MLKNFCASTFLSHVVLLTGGKIKISQKKIKENSSKQTQKIQRQIPQKWTNNSVIINNPCILTVRAVTNTPVPTPKSKSGNCLCSGLYPDACEPLLYSPPPPPPHLLRNRLHGTGFRGPQTHVNAPHACNHVYVWNNSRSWRQECQMFAWSGSVFVPRQFSLSVLSLDFGCLPSLWLEIHLLLCFSFLFCKPNELRCSSCAYVSVF